MSEELERLKELSEELISPARLVAELPGAWGTRR